MGSVIDTAEVFSAMIRNRCTEYTDFIKQDPVAGCHRVSYLPIRNLSA